MKTKIEILKKVCGYSETEDIEMSDDITIEEALEAMEQYADSRIEGGGEEKMSEDEINSDFIDWMGWNGDLPDEDDPDYYTFSWGLNVWNNAYKFYSNKPPKTK
jgi:hypothetical protein